MAVELGRDDGYVLAQEVNETAAGTAVAELASYNYPVSSYSSNGPPPTNAGSMHGVEDSEMAGLQSSFVKLQPSKVMVKVKETIPNVYADPDDAIRLQKSSALNWSPENQAVFDADASPDTPPWYHGTVSEESGFTVLNDADVGTFIVRHAFAEFWELIVVEADGPLGHRIRKIRGQFQFAATNEKDIKSCTMSGLVELLYTPNVRGWSTQLHDFRPRPRVALSVVDSERARLSDIASTISHDENGSRLATSPISRHHAIQHTIRSRPSMTLYEHEVRDSGLDPVVHDQSSSTDGCYDDLTTTPTTPQMPRSPRLASRLSSSQATRPPGSPVLSRHRTASHPFSRMPWWLGKGDAKVGAAELVSKPTGTYLLRESPNRPGSYTLSVMCDKKVTHIRIAKNGNTFCLSGVSDLNAPKFPSIIELVQHYRINFVASEVQTVLRYPALEIDRMDEQKLEIVNRKSSISAPAVKHEHRYEYDEGSSNT